MIVNSARRYGRRRSAFLFVLMATMLLWLGGQLADVQVVHARSILAGSGADQAVKVIPATRGSIYDRNFKLLAVSVRRYMVISDNLRRTRLASQAASLLSPLLGKSPAQLRVLLSENAGYVVLKRMLNRAQANAVRSEVFGHLNVLSRVTVAPEPLRVLPNGNLAAPVIGTVRMDSAGSLVGTSGLEYEFQKLLAGRPGKELPIGPSGAANFFGTPQVIRPAVPGDGLVLTIDNSLQFEVEHQLALEIAKSGAVSGTAAIMDTKTGAILALANLARSANGMVVEAPSNLGLTAVYEPGSVFKIVTFSAALQNHIITPQTTFTVPDHVVIDGALFHDAEVHPTQQMTARHIIAVSSNVGTIHIAQLVGKTLISRYIKAFGFGKLTGIGFPGESPGILVPPNRWSPTAIGSTPIGQDDAVTPVQMLAAMNAVANGGVLVPPRLVRATVGPKGTIHPYPLPPARRIISASTASELNGMLQKVVQYGTGVHAVIPGYKVAGKTGTAQIPIHGAHGYQPGAFMATFAGFAPANSPALTAIVVLNRPHDIYGGAVSAPVFSNIMQYALHLFRVAPSGAGAPPPRRSRIIQAIPPGVATTTRLAATVSATGRVNSGHP